MPKGPAARVGDPVSHAAPPTLSGAGSPNVFIRGKPAWRGVGAAAVPALLSAKEVADKAITAVELNTAANVGQPGFAAAKTAEDTLKQTTAATMSTNVTSAAAGGGDIHTCSTPLPLPPHGPGVVIDGSMTVFINNLPACRQGDTIVEAVGPPNKISQGEPSVHIGG